MKEILKQEGQNQYTAYDESALHAFYISKSIIYIDKNHTASLRKMEKKEFSDVRM